MDMRRLLRRYSEDVKVITKEAGSWVDGIWVPGQDTETVASAAVLPLSQDDLVADDGGTYTVDDKKMFIHMQLTQGQDVEIAGDVFTVQAERDLATHAKGLRIYYMVRKGESSD